MTSTDEDERTRDAALARPPSGRRPTTDLVDLGAAATVFVEPGPAA